MRRGAPAPAQGRRPTGCAFLEYRTRQGRGDGRQHRGRWRGNSAGAHTCHTKSKHANRSGELAGQRNLAHLHGPIRWYALPCKRHVASLEGSCRLIGQGSRHGTVASPHVLRSTRGAAKAVALVKPGSKFKTRNDEPAKREAEWCIGGVQPPAYRKSRLIGILTRSTSAPNRIRKIAGALLPIDGWIVCKSASNSFLQCEECLGMPF